MIWDKHDIIVAVFNRGGGQKKKKSEKEISGNAE